MSKERELVETVLFNVQSFRVADTFGAAGVLKTLLPEIMQPNARAERRETGNAIIKLLAAFDETPRPDLIPPWEHAMAQVKARRAALASAA